MMDRCEIRWLPSWVLGSPALASTSLSKSIYIQVINYVTTLVIIPFRHRGFMLTIWDFSYTIPKSQWMTSRLQVEMAAVAATNVSLRPHSPKLS